MEKKTISFYVAAKLDEEFGKRAKEVGISRNALATLALSEYIGKKSNDEVRQDYLGIVKDESDFIEKSIKVSQVS